MSQKLEPVIRDICGDRKGWNAHNRHKESQCGPCLKANAEYMRDYRRRHGLTNSTLYTELEIEQIRWAAVNDAVRQFAAVHLKKRASRRGK